MYLTRMHLIKCDDEWLFRAGALLSATANEIAEVIKTIIILINTLCSNWHIINCIAHSTLLMEPAGCIPKPSHEMQSH